VKPCHPGSSLEGGKVTVAPVCTAERTGTMLWGAGVSRLVAQTRSGKKRCLSTGQSCPLMTHVLSFPSVLEERKKTAHKWGVGSMEPLVGKLEGRARHHFKVRVTAQE